MPTTIHTRGTITLTITHSRTTVAGIIIIERTSAECAAVECPFA